MNDIANFSLFESPKGLHKNSVPQHPKISCDFRATIHLEVWGQDVWVYNVLVCLYNKNFSPIKFIDCVEFSVLLMVGITLAKNWCVK